MENIQAHRYCFAWQLIVEQESLVHTKHAEIDDLLHQAKNSEEKAKKAMVDAGRLAGDSPVI